MLPDSHNPYGPRMTAAMKHYGIDPASENSRGQLESIRADVLEAEGYEATICFHCKCAFPKMFSRAALCRSCHYRQIRNDRIFLSRAMGKRKPSANSGWSVRVDDGAGCTERLPRWSADWDGNPHG